MGKKVAEGSTNLGITPPKATNLTPLDQTNHATGLDLSDMVKGNCPP